MSDFDQYMHDDFEFDQPEEVVKGGSKTRFAKARLYHFLYVNRFQSGQHFTLPGVYFDEYDENAKTSTRQGLKEFRGMTLSKKPTQYRFYPLILEQFNEKGQPYQRVLQFGNWQDKSDTGCAWTEFQKAEIAKLPAKDSKALVEAAKKNDWAYIRYTEVPTGYEGQYEIKNYLTDIKVYANEAEWQKENEAHFAQFGKGVQSNGTGGFGLDLTPYPVDWDADAIAPCLADIANAVANQSIADALKLTFLVEKDGVTKSHGGDPVDLKWLLTEAVQANDMPDLLAKVEAYDYPKK